MAKLPMPGIAEGPLRDLFSTLHGLHARAGWPSTRVIMEWLDQDHRGEDERFRVGKTAVRELFVIGELPNPTLLLKVTRVLALHAIQRPAPHGETVDDWCEQMDGLWMAALDSGTTESVRNNTVDRSPRYAGLPSYDPNSEEGPGHRTALLAEIARVGELSDRVRRAAVQALARAVAAASETEPSDRIVTRQPSGDGVLLVLDQLGQESVDLAERILRGMARLTTELRAVVQVHIVLARGLSSVADGKVYGHMLTDAHRISAAPQYRQILDANPNAIGLLAITDKVRAQVRADYPLRPMTVSTKGENVDIWIRVVA